jgi:hypothetical protein
MLRIMNPLSGLYLGADFLLIGGRKARQPLKRLHLILQLRVAVPVHGQCDGAVPGKALRNLGMVNSTSEFLQTKINEL